MSARRARRVCYVCYACYAWLLVPLLGAWAALAAPAAAQTPSPAPGTDLPRVEVALTPLPRPHKLLRERLTVGDRVEAVLTLDAPAALQGPPRFPAWGTAWGDAEVLEKGPAAQVAERGGVATWRQRVVVAAYRTGRVPLPPVAIAVPLPERTVQAQTPASLALEVASVLPPGKKDLQPKPAARPRQLPLGAPFWWTAAALSAACLAAGLALWRRRRALAGEGARPALAPFAELAAGLDALDPEGPAVLLHTRLSLALRRYLARTLGVKAVEGTTSEIHRELAGRRLPAATVRRAVDLLRACDMVKFARQEVAPERSRDRVLLAREVAGEVEAHVHPVPRLASDEEPALLERAG